MCIEMRLGRAAHEAATRLQAPIIPAKAGIQFSSQNAWVFACAGILRRNWIPACAGMSGKSDFFPDSHARLA
jgi:hypothetical protein